MNTRKVVIIIILLILLLLLATNTLAVAPEKVTICHATSSETNPYTRIVVSENAIGGHFDNPGTPKAGHEDDLLLQGEVDCPAPEVTPTPTEGVSPTLTPTPETREVTPSQTPTPTETIEPTVTPTGQPVNNPEKPKENEKYINLSGSSLGHPSRSGK